MSDDAKKEPEITIQLTGDGGIILINGEPAPPDFYEKTREFLTEEIDKAIIEELMKAALSKTIQD